MTLADFILRMLLGTAIIAMVGILGSALLWLCCTEDGQKILAGLLWLGIIAVAVVGFPIAVFQIGHWALHAVRP